MYAGDGQVAQQPVESAVSNSVSAPRYRELNRPKGPVTKDSAPSPRAGGRGRNV